MEAMLSRYTNLKSVLRQPYKPDPVTAGEFATALNQIEAKHQKNTEFLENPHPTVNPTEFHEQAIAAQQVAHDLITRESTMGLLPARNNLAHGQEVLLYGTSPLRAAIMAWIHAVDNEEDYNESRLEWVSCIFHETVSEDIVIDNYLITNTNFRRNS
jgi:hypothetical protein